jgi:hypothetical protein
MERTTRTDSNESFVIVADGSFTLTRERRATPRVLSLWQSFRGTSSAFFRRARMARALKSEKRTVR